MKIKIKQQLSSPEQTQFDAYDNFIVIFNKTKNISSWPEFPYREIVRQRIEKQGKIDCSTAFTTDLPNELGTKLTVVCIQPEISNFELLTLARKLVSPYLHQNVSEIAVSLPEMAFELAQRVTEAVVASLLASNHRMPSFKSKQFKDTHFSKLIIYYPEQKFSFKRTHAEMEGNNLARYLTYLPPNELTPNLYQKRISELAQAHGWKMEFFDIKALQRKKAGAFLAVAQGSATHDAGIVYLRYDPVKHTKQAPLALVGKGICFDTGGTNLKSARSMHGMHEDMEGSAVALGTLLALSNLKVDFPVECWLALAQNHIGPSAYKQNDVVTACNGTTIEIIHTDAEGRMVLADTLALASRKKPALIIDFATLTGSCINALGTSYSGVLTNRINWIYDIIEAGKDSGERVWPFPNDNDFDSALESNIADIKQCTLDSEADHILAFRFLNHFVPDDTPWIHLDLAAGNHKGGLAHIPTDTTGFGVRFTLNLLLDREFINKARKHDSEKKSSPSA